MSRINFSEILSGYLAADKLNEVLAAIEAAFDRVVFKDGTAPNAMTADLDLGGHALLNSSASEDNPLSVPTFQQVQDYVAQHSSGLVLMKHERQTATAGQTVVTISGFDYHVGTDNLAVYVNGVRKFATYDFAETDTGSITFLSPLVGGEKIDLYSEQFVATLGEKDHTHPWAQITAIPEYATRWPTWTEVTNKPETFAPASHTHSATEIMSGRLADARRGVWVQSAQPTAGSVGEIWAW